MFEITHNEVQSLNKPIDEVLTKGFTDFVELRYGFDPSFESKVVCDLISNLTAQLVLKHGEFTSRLWIQRYGEHPYEFKPQDGYKYIDYADQLGTMFKIYEYDKGSEFEMIRMLVCYAKLKGIDVQKIF